MSLQIKVESPFGEVFVVLHSATGITFRFLTEAQNKVNGVLFRGDLFVSRRVMGDRGMVESEGGFWRMQADRTYLRRLGEGKPLSLTARDRLCDWACETAYKIATDQNVVRANIYRLNKDADEAAECVQRLREELEMMLTVAEAKHKAFDEAFKDATKKGFLP